MNNPSGSGSYKEASNHKKKIEEYKEKEKLLQCIKNLREKLENQTKSEVAEKKNLLEQIRRSNLKKSTQNYY